MIDNTKQATLPSSFSMTSFKKSKYKNLSYDSASDYKNRGISVLNEYSI